MPTLTLKNVPGDLIERLRRRAAEERRSLNQEAIQILDRVLRALEMRDGREERAARQVEAWERIAGRWRSAETAAEEIGKLYAARTPGRDVDL